MTTNKLIMNRAFYIKVYNEIESGKSYPDIAKAMNLPVIKAFPAFATVEEAVEHSPKMQLECLVYRKAHNDDLAKIAVDALETNGYTSIKSLKSLTVLSFQEVRKAIEALTQDPQVRHIIFSVIKYAKGA